MTDVCIATALPKLTLHLPSKSDRIAHQSQHQCGARSDATQLADP